MYPNRELFPETPLALVAAEVRFTDSARLRQQATLDAVTMALEERFPFAHPSQQAGFQIVVGAGPTPPQAPPSSKVILTNGEKTESLALTSTSLAYETTDYTEFTDLLDTVQHACRAMLGAGVRPALQRIGLRYIDEIRVPTPITDVREWSEWIDHRLVDHLDVGPAGDPVRMTEGVTIYDLGDGKGLNFRFAALSEGMVVAPQILRRPRPVGGGPFFVLDFDGYHEFHNQLAVPLDPELVGQSLAVVHTPAGAAFQNAITDKARELFRGSKS